MSDKDMLERLRANFSAPSERNESRPNNYYPFWNMKAGEQAVIRFLPDKDSDNPMGFMVEKLNHVLTVNGKNEKVPCLKMYDQECPICKVSAAYYKDKDEANGKKYWRKKQHLAQALIIEDPLPVDAETGESHEGKVRFIALGYQIFEVIKESFQSGDLDEIPYAYKGGCDFIIKKTQQGEHGNYSVGSRFARRSTDLTEDQIALVEDNIVELISLIPTAPSLDTVEGKLEAALNGGDYVTESNTSSPSMVSVDNTPSPVSTAPVAEETSSDENVAEVDDMLAAIRARQSQNV